MPAVCILGAGELGGAIAHALARSERVSRVLLVDSTGRVAAGKALDIQQSGAIEGFHVRLDGTDDFTRVTAAAVVVIADRAGERAVEWEGEEGLGLVKRISAYANDSPLVFAGASQAGLLLAATREAGVRRERLIGSAPEAFASAARAIVALEARCSPSEVSLSVLGVPPGPVPHSPGSGGFVVPWSDASIGGRALERVLTQVELSRVEARVARLWPPGPFALGLAAARVVDAIVGSSRRAFNVLTVLGGEFGVRNRVGTLAALLSTTGIVHTRIPPLNAKERVRLETVLGA
jgi:malate dehydrogenase